MSSGFKRKSWCILSIMFLSLLLLTLTYAKTGIPSPTQEFFVNDYAGVLSAETKKYIFDTSKQYMANGGQQVVVTTVTSLEGESIESYSLEMAREWGIGSKSENNGVLILLAVEDRSIRVEVGYGLEGTITDSMSGRFIREASEELSADNFDSGILKLYQLVIRELEAPGSYEETQKGNNTTARVSFLIVLLIIILFIFRRPRGGGGYRGFGGGYMGGFGGGFHGGSGGGFGGGGFSGGGGGFGGGGASGKFCMPITHIKSVVVK